MTIAALLLFVGAPLASAQDAWSTRWRHGEATLGSEPDLSAASVTLFGDLVLVSEPYVPSHCGEMTPYEGRVIALDRRDGAYRWSRRVPQTTDDQNAYLRAHVVDDDVVVFETAGAMRALDADGGHVWERGALGDACGGGGAMDVLGDVRRAGASLVWQGWRGGTCRLHLPSGRVRHVSAETRAVGRSVPRHRARTCGLRAPRSGWILGRDCDGRGAAWVEVIEPSAGERRLVVRHARSAVGGV